MTDPGPNDSPILMTRRGNLAQLTLNRPRVYNALDLALVERLLDAVLACDEDPDIRAVMITGAGKAFCAGGDVRMMHAIAGPPGATPPFMPKLATGVHAVVAALARMPKPVVTAVNGPAAGAGFGLALAGDLVLAAESATFTTAYAAIAQASDGGASYILPRLVGPKRAFEIFASARVMAPAEALSLGMINATYPDAEFRDRALARAAELANGPTQGLGALKKLLALSADSGLETQMEHERRAVIEGGRTEDFREGLAAFMEKRPPVFKGR